MADQRSRRYLVLPLATAYGTGFESFEAAAAAAGKKVDQDRRPHVIVEVVGEARPRVTPNVEVVRFGARAVANG